MAFEKAKSGRTPEQQAARDARKAAKKAAAAAVEAASSSETKPDVESVTLTTTDGPETITTEVDIEAAGDGEGEGESSKATSKKRKHNQDVEELEVDLEAPTPMNKKEARLAKKKAKRVEDGEEEPTTDKPAAPKQVHVEKRNSVWVGNLSFRTTPERLQEFFEAGVKELGGMDGSVTRVNLPKEIGKGGFSNNKGFAYVDFKSEEDQKLAIELSERLLEGRKLLIKLGNDYAPKPDARTPKPIKPKGLDKQVHAESSTVFVGNLPFDATEEGLRDMIEANAAAGASKPKSREPGSTTEEVKPEPSAEAGADGETEGEVVAGPSRGGKNSGLRKVRLGAFEDTGRCKGFAFLDFKSPAEATAALTHRGNKFFLGRRLTLQYASEEATKRSGGGTKRPPPAGAAGSGAGRPDGDRPPRRAPRPTATDGESAPAEASYQDRPRPPRPSAPEASGPKDTRGKKWEAAGRKAPGAALAAAKREKVGIVEATGTKVVFD